MAQQIKSITSEALEAAFRDLVPSQEGFTEDLMASNTIIPVLDLSSAAEGSTVSESLQTSLAFGSQTAFEASNATTNLANTAGFWRVVATSTGWFAGSTNFSTNEFIIDDGTTTKRVWAHNIYANAANPAFGSLNVDLIFFLRAGDTLQAKTNNVAFFLEGSYRQIADVNGTLINPSGFTPQ